MLGLLPPGAAWPQHMQAVLPDLLQSFADEFTRLHLRADQLLEERSLLSTYELLDEWELDLDLPDICDQSARDSDARRAAIAARMLSSGEQTIAYYLQVLSAYGIQASITEYKPGSVDSDVDAAVGGDDWIYAWQVDLPESMVREFTVINGVDDALAEWGNTFVECLIRRLAPAHTIPLFGYQ